MSNEIVIQSGALPAESPALVMAAAGRTDELIVRMWVANKRSRHTRRLYEADAQRLFGFTKKSLGQITLEDLQGFAAHLETSCDLAPNSRKRILAGVKSLFSFASDPGVRHLRYNVSAAIQLPRAKDALNERILTEAQVQDLIAGAEGRNRMIVEMLYLTGVRAEELTALCWRDAREDGAGGILTVFGKGKKTRHLRLEADTWTMLKSWRGMAGDNHPIFQSRRRGPLSTVQVWRIVTDAAKRAGLKASTHWLRHCHSSHAIDHGCDIRTLQQSLGHASSETTERYVHSRPKQSSGAFIQRPPAVESGDENHEEKNVGGGTVRDRAGERVVPRPGSAPRPAPNAPEPGAGGQV